MYMYIYPTAKSEACALKSAYVGDMGAFLTQAKAP